MVNQSNPNHRKEPAENPNRRRTFYMVNLIFMGCLTILSLLLAVSAILLPGLLGKGGGKKLYTRSRIEEIKSAAAQEKEEELLSRMESSLEAGSSMTQVLREVFHDRVVVVSDGRFFFYPVSEKAEKNVLASGSLQRRDDIVVCASDTPSTQISRGVLLSDDNGKIDWNRLADSEIGEVMITVGVVTERGFTEDEQYERNCRKAAEKGIRAGLCVKVRGIADREILSEAAEAAAAMIRKYGPLSQDGTLDRAVLLRIHTQEDMREDEKKKREWTGTVRQLCSLLEEKGSAPVLGMSLFTCAAQIDLDELYSYDRWLINHEQTPGCPYRFSFWEYTGSGRAEGVPGNAVLYARITYTEQDGSAQE
ncbi:MAG: hypothetical protein Q4D81_00265 [Eubacteriales bacterium]|nr:hypothetical protein [Eubacteriales bacterium]